MKIVGKIVNLFDEMKFIGNIEESSVEGSVNLNVLATFDYKNEKLIILCDSNGMGFSFTYTEHDNIMTLSPIENEKLEIVVNDVLKMICENES